MSRILGRAMTSMTSHLLSILHDPAGDKNGLGDESDDQGLGSIGSILHGGVSLVVDVEVEGRGNCMKLRGRQHGSSHSHTLRNAGNPVKPEY